MSRDPRGTHPRVYRDTITNRIALAYADGGLDGPDPDTLDDMARWQWRNTCNGIARTLRDCAHALPVAASALPGGGSEAGDPALIERAHAVADGLEAYARRVVGHVLTRTVAVGAVVTDGGVPAIVASNTYADDAGEGQVILHDCNGEHVVRRYSAASEARVLPWTREDFDAFAALPEL